MQSIIKELKKLSPATSFRAGTSFFWSPKDQTVTYRVGQSVKDTDILALLHEFSHAILQHTNYQTDFELMMMEVAAWQQASQLAKNFKIPLDENHVQDCLDTYREWLYMRSACPECTCTSLQSENGIYHCHNCNNSWRVSRSRFCRAYRRNITKKSEVRL